MDIQALITQLLPVIGQTGVDALSEQLDELSRDSDSVWQQTALTLLADAVDVHGMKGIDLAQKAIDDLFENKVPNIDWANPRTASDLVAKMQNAEADDKDAAREFFVKLGDVFGQIAAAMLKGFIANA